MKKTTRTFVVALIFCVYFFTIGYCVTYYNQAMRIVEQKQHEIIQLNETIQEYKNMVKKLNKQVD